ncbi:CARD- and ANK-domain containing inflammasome adapter protein-like [Bufo gargarizans]|uniref:CARD- and ANK-domain containing inflammasome adapter protein-like n=1 Tax=Bufo gargarizans TaxID=30331 RepID=UPI001CF2AE2D|nr:CARD- and ANK-domain containing inflammasome adapter protein-like [Bufo gargarizans]
MSAASSVLFPLIPPQGQFKNPYAVDVLKTKKEELIEGIKNPEELINLLVDHGIFSTDKKMVMSYYRTRTEKNSRLVDILLSKGERACRLFFYPCLKQIEPSLYNSIKSYVNHVNNAVGDGRRQLVGYLLERDKEENRGPVNEPPEKIPRKENLPKTVKKETQKPSVKVKEKKSPPPETPRQKVGQQSTVGVFDAVMKGDLSTLEAILKGSNVNAVNSSGETLLHVAASNGHVPVIEFLLSKGAKVDAKDKKRRTPLHRAAENGHIEAARVLLQAGANMYSLDSDSQSPLHLAAQNNHHHLVKLLLQEEGKRYKNRTNFLHQETSKDNSRLVEILLKNGASVDGMDEKKRTALYHAVSGGHEATVKVLLEAGATIDPSIIDVAFSTNNEYIFGLLLQYSKGLSPDTMISAMFKAVKLNLFGIIKALIDKGTDVNARNDIQYTPLLLAAELGKSETAQALIEKGAQVSDRTPNLNTALHLSVQAGDVSTTNLLLRKGINVNITGPGEQTPLHVAAYHNRPDLSDILLAAGANVNAVTKESVTPLHLASQRNNVDVARNLIEHKANVNAKDKHSKTPLHMATEGGGLPLVQLLLNSKADPNVPDKEKKTPLHLAAIGGNSEVVSALLNSGARCGVKDMDGCTPIHYAIISGNVDVVKSLLTAGKNKNLEDKNVWRKTPLHLAAEHGHSDIIHLLLTNGAAIDPLDSNRDTPLHCACRAGHLSSVQTLVGWTQGQKANLQATNSLKKTPLQVAEAESTDGHQQVATLLKKKMLIIK